MQNASSFRATHSYTAILAEVERADYKMSLDEPRPSGQSPQLMQQQLDDGTAKPTARTAEYCSGTADLLQP